MPSSTTPTSTTTASPLPSWHFKPLHEMTPAERLAALLEWAEEKKYSAPGEGGMLGGIGAGGSLRGLGDVSSSAGSGARVARAHSVVVTGRYGGGAGAGEQELTRQVTARVPDRYAAQYEAPVGPPAYDVATREEGVVRPDEDSKWRRWLEKRRVKKQERREERERRDSGLPDYEP